MAATYLINGDTLTEVADAIRAKKGTSARIAVVDMASEISSMSIGGGDSPLPIEISTEAEMTALLESAEVGSVYRYTGKTGTYEKGALYVVEESE